MSFVVPEDGFEISCRLTGAMINATKVRLTLVLLNPN